MRQHVKELISKLEELGIKPSPEGDSEDDEWEGYEGSDGSASDVEMS